MARASRIYVVETSEPDSEVLAAFTVKHELKSWLMRYKASPDGLGTGHHWSELWVVSTPDGVLGDHTNQTSLAAQEYLDGR